MTQHNHAGICKKPKPREGPYSCPVIYCACGNRLEVMRWNARARVACVEVCGCGATEVGKRLNCNHIECHMGRDILASIYEAMAHLPCNGVQGILAGAAQEIQALRDANLAEPVVTDDFEPLGCYLKREGG